MRQARFGRRFGVERLPVLTGVVFAVTAITSASQLAIPGMLEAAQRTAQGLHGDWWRTFTALFVQDGGALGAISNLAFLLVIGVLAQQILRPWQWLTCYFGAGLAGELAGYAWQPRGAGNSVAICGLAGALIVALLRSPARVPRLTPVCLLYWCGGLLGSLFWPGFAVCVIGAALVPALRQGLPVGRPAGAACALVALILLAATDVHGAALVTGLAIALLFGRGDRLGGTQLARPAPT